MAPSKIPIAATLNDALGAWLHCIECDRNELEQLARFGPQAVPFLRKIQQEGLPTADVENYRIDLQKRLRRSPWSETVRNRVVNLYVSGLQAGVRDRARLALIHIERDAAAKRP